MSGIEGNISAPNTNSERSESILPTHRIIPTISWGIPPDRIIVQTALHSLETDYDSDATYYEPSLINGNTCNKESETMIPDELLSSLAEINIDIGHEESCGQALNELDIVDWVDDDCRPVLSNSPIDIVEDIEKGGDSNVEVSDQQSSFGIFESSVEAKITDQLGIRIGKIYINTMPTIAITSENDQHSLLEPKVAGKQQSACYRAVTALGAQKPANTNDEQPKRNIKSMRTIRQLLKKQEREDKLKKSTSAEPVSNDIKIPNLKIRRKKSNLSKQSVTATHKKMLTPIDHRQVKALEVAPSLRMLREDLFSISHQVRIALFFHGPPLTPGLAEERLSEVQRIEDKIKLCPDNRANSPKIREMRQVIEKLQGMLKKYIAQLGNEENKLTTLREETIYELGEESEEEVSLSNYHLQKIFGIEESDNPISKSSSNSSKELCKKMESTDTTCNKPVHCTKNGPHKQASEPLDNINIQNGSNDSLDMFSTDDTGSQSNQYSTCEPTETAYTSSKSMLNQRFTTPAENIRSIQLPFKLAQSQDLTKNCHNLVNTSLIPKQVLKFPPTMQCDFVPKVGVNKTYSLCADKKLHIPDKSNSLNDKVAQSSCSKSDQLANKENVNMCANDCIIPRKRAKIDNQQSTDSSSSHPDNSFNTLLIDLTQDEEVASSPKKLPPKANTMLQPLNYVSVSNISPHIAFDPVNKISPRSSLHKCQSQKPTISQVGKQSIASPQNAIFQLATPSETQMMLADSQEQCTQDVQNSHPQKTLQIKPLVIAHLENCCSVITPTTVSKEAPRNTTSQPNKDVTYVVIKHDQDINKIAGFKNVVSPANLKFTSLQKILPKSSTFPLNSKQNDTNHIQNQMLKALTPETATTDMNDSISQSTQDITQLMLDDTQDITFQHQFVPTRCPEKMSSLPAAEITHNIPKTHSDPRHKMAYQAPTKSLVQDITNKPMDCISPSVSTTVPAQSSYSREISIFTNQGALEETRLILGVTKIRIPQAIEFVPNSTTVQEFWQNTHWDNLPDEWKNDLEDSDES